MKVFLTFFLIAFIFISVIGSLILWGISNVPDPQPTESFKALAGLMIGAVCGILLVISAIADYLNFP